MKRTILAIAVAALLMVGTQAFGEICAVDNVPAATLLVPYFSVGDCDGANWDTAPTTFWTIANASDSPVVAHVTVWTDWSVPEIDFDIYLTGYDVQSFDMKNIFCDNPATAAAGGDLPSTYYGKFPEGPYSVDPGASPSACGTVAGDPPNYGPGAIVPQFQNHLRLIFTGQASGGVCGGSVGDGTYHGYVTIDANNNCSLNFPSQAAYWSSGVTYNDENGNVLWGDYQYLNIGDRSSEGFTMVHIEAFAAIAAGPEPSFYGRYLGNGSDGREPLPTTYAARYNANGAITDTYFQIWRTGGAATAEGSCNTNPFAACNAADQCVGLDLNFALAFNNDEDVQIVTGGPSGGPAQAEVCVDWETQNLNVYDDLASVFNNGWYYLNLQSTCTDGQAYLTVTQKLDVGGAFSGGWDGVALDGSCTQFAGGVTVTPAQPTAANPTLK